MKYLKPLLSLMTLLFSLNATANNESYTPSCPQGQSYEIKQNTKDNCLKPPSVVILEKQIPTCKHTIQHYPGRDRCYRNTHDKFDYKYVKCPSPLTLTKDVKRDPNGRRHEDECQKRLESPMTRTKVACKNKFEQHQTQGRDVCVKLQSNN